MTSTHIKSNFPPTTFPDVIVKVSILKVRDWVNKKNQLTVTSAGRIGLGGYHNIAIGNQSFVGGRNTVSSGNFSFVGGGHNNTASGSYGVVSGGHNNTAIGSPAYSDGLGNTTRQMSEDNMSFKSNRQ